MGRQLNVDHERVGRRYKAAWPVAGGTAMRDQSETEPTLSSRWCASRKRDGTSAPASPTRSATISPISGANFAPCPEHGEQTTTGPTRSSRKSSLGDVVYRHVASPCGIGTR